MKLLPCLLLLLFVGCASPRGRPTFAKCMTGPRDIDHDLEHWPVFKNGCRVHNWQPDYDIDMKDMQVIQNHYEKYVGEQL